MLFKRLQGTVSVLHLNARHTHADVIPPPPKRTGESNKPALCSESTGWGGRDAQGGLGWGPHTGHLGTTQAEPADRCRATSSLAETGQSNKMKIHNYLGNQITGEAVT